jgi:hypothetical protein
MRGGLWRKFMSIGAPFCLHLSPYAVVVFPTATRVKCQTSPNHTAALSDSSSHFNSVLATIIYIIPFWRLLLLASFTFNKTRFLTIMTMATKFTMLASPSHRKIYILPSHAIKDPTRTAFLNKETWSMAEHTRVADRQFHASTRCACAPHFQPDFKFVRLRQLPGAGQYLAGPRCLS